MSHEGLSSDSGHWIKLERARLKEKRKERERGRGMAELGKNTVATMAGRRKLAGVKWMGSYGAQFSIPKA